VPVPQQLTHELGIWGRFRRGRWRHACPGGPSSGKGTLCALLAKEYGFVHLSTGDLLRAEAAKATEQGQAIAALMREGAFVPLVRPVAAAPHTQSTS